VSLLTSHLPNLLAETQDLVARVSVALSPYYQ